jgi:hypothetical protein
MIAVYDNLSFESARKLQAVEKHIAWVAVARISGSFANVLVAVPRFIIARIRYPCAPEFDPVDVEVARVLITVSRIIPTRVRHRALPPVTRDRCACGSNVLARARWAREAVSRRDAGI